MLVSPIKWKNSSWLRRATPLLVLIMNILWGHSINTWTRWGRGVQKWLLLSTLRVKKLSTQGGGGSQKMSKFCPRSCWMAHLPALQWTIIYHDLNSSQQLRLTTFLHCEQAQSTFLVIGFGMGDWKKTCRTKKNWDLNNVAIYILILIFKVNCYFIFRSQCLKSERRNIPLFKPWYDNLLHCSCQFVL